MDCLFRFQRMFSYCEFGHRDRLHHWKLSRFESDISTPNPTEPDTLAGVLSDMAETPPERLLFGCLILVALREGVSSLSTSWVEQWFDEILVPFRALVFEEIREICDLNSFLALCPRRECCRPGWRHFIPASFFLMSLISLHRTRH